MGIDTSAREEVNGPKEDENVEETLDEEAPSTLEGPYKTLHPDIFKVKWRLKNFASITEHCCRSPNFDIAGVKWCILLYPKGTVSTQRPDTNVSIFLESKAAMLANPSLEVDACFELLVENSNPTLSEGKQLHFKFTAAGTDWGFRDFMKVSFVLNPENGFLIDGALVVQVMLRRLRDLEIKEFVQNKDPFLWIRDSKSETGFVGLKNQGATCYMNSLLQALYHVPALRKAVYQMPTEVETMKRQRTEGAHPAVLRRDEPRDADESIALALQRVFYRLQHSNNCVGTKQLTKSFGWDSYDAFTQHDVQELDRVLLDNLEEKMKGTAVDGVVPGLFRGKLKNFVKCIHIDYKSERVEDFYDLSLNVKGCPNVTESLRKYIERERLDGDNKYMAEGHGLQDAEKGCAFLTFPPVLHLHLKRFEYDPMRDTNVKINDRFEFDEEIDLGEYLEDGAQEPHVYCLHSVLVHSGDVHGGHYFAYIRPDCRTDWFKFNDEKVSRASPEEAVHSNFGIDPDDDASGSNNSGNGGLGLLGGGGAMRRGLGLQRKFSNAYMLVYVRRSEIPRVLAPVTPADIPEHLRARFSSELEEEEIRRKERQEAPKKMTITVVTPAVLDAHKDADLCRFDGGTPGLLQLSVYRSMTVRELKEVLEATTGVTQARQRLWLIVRRENHTWRPDDSSSFDDPDRRLLDIGWDMGRSSSVTSNSASGFYAMGAGHHEGRLYLEEVAVDPHGRVNPVNNKVLIFFKYYSRRHAQLWYAGSIFFLPDIRVRDLRRTLQVLLTGNIASAESHGVGDDESTLRDDCRGVNLGNLLRGLTLYEEVTPRMLDSLDLNKTLRAAELVTGDIIVIDSANELPRSRSAPAERPPRFSSCVEYYDFLANRVTVRFRRLRRPTDEWFSLELSQMFDYDKVVSEVADRIHELAVASAASARERAAAAQAEAEAAQAAVARQSADPGCVAAGGGVDAAALAAAAISAAAVAASTASASAAAAAARPDPFRLQLFGHILHSDRPRDIPAQRSTNWTLRDILPSLPKDKHVIYVAEIPFSVLDLETNRQLRIRCPFLTSIPAGSAVKPQIQSSFDIGTVGGGDDDPDVLVLAPKEGTIADVLVRLREAVMTRYCQDDSEGHDGRYRRGSSGGSRVGSCCADGGSNSAAEGWFAELLEGWDRVRICQVNESRIVCVLSDSDPVSKHHDHSSSLYAVRIYPAPPRSFVEVAAPVLATESISTTKDLSPMAGEQSRKADCALVKTSVCCVRSTADGGVSRSDNAHSVAAEVGRLATSESKSTGDNEPGGDQEEEDSEINAAVIAAAAASDAATVPVKLEPAVEATMVLAGLHYEMDKAAPKSQSTPRPFGDPFLVEIGATETFGALKRRVRSLFAGSEEPPNATVPTTAHVAHGEVNHPGDSEAGSGAAAAVRSSSGAGGAGPGGWRVVFFNVRNKTVDTFFDVQDSELLSHTKLWFSNQWMLALEHADSRPRNASRGGVERCIKISR